jgi:hypothetical protein
VSGRCVRTGGIAADHCEVIAHVAHGAAGLLLDVERGPDQVSGGSHVAIFFADFDAPDLLRRLDLREILDTSLALRIGACFDVVRNGDRDQEADDRNYDQDFDEGETSAGSAEPCNFHRFF